MHCHLPASIRCLLLSISLSAIPSLADNQHEHDPDLWHFVTRPELKPPKWDIEVYDRERLSDGYWFLSAKPSQEETLGTGHNWWGPAIYDQNGEVVWSGADQLDSPNVMDFTLSQVDGEPMLTMLDRDRAAGVLLDASYEVVDMVKVTEEKGPNGHEFHFVDNGKGGTSVLFVLNNMRDAPQEDLDDVDVGGWGKTCTAQYLEFRELDVSNGWETLFEWDSMGHIHLNESTSHGKCDKWDFM